MTLPVGLPVQYRASDGVVYPGVIMKMNDDASAVDHVLYFNPTVGRWEISPEGVTNDDTLATDNSWGAITFYTPA